MPPPSKLTKSHASFYIYPSTSHRVDSLTHTLASGSKLTPTSPPCDLMISPLALSIYNFIQFWFAMAMGFPHTSRGYREIGPFPCYDRDISLCIELSLKSKACLYRNPVRKRYFSGSENRGRGGERGRGRQL